MHGVGEMWQSNLVISLYIKHRSFITLQHHVPDSNRFIQVSRVQLYCPAQEDPGVGMWSQESRSGGTSRCLYSLRCVLAAFQSNIAFLSQTVHLKLLIAFRNCVIPCAIFY